MFRTLLVLIFLAACGVYFHQSGSESSQPQTKSPKAEAPKLLDDSDLKALKDILPSQLFKKDVQPAIKQNTKEGLTNEQVQQLVSRLTAMSRELEGKAAEAADNAAKALRSSMSGQEKNALKDGAEAAGDLARKAGNSIKESMPAIKETSQNILSGIIAILSQLLSSAAELIKK